MPMQQLLCRLEFCRLSVSAPSKLVPAEGARLTLPFPRLRLVPRHFLLLGHEVAEGWAGPDV
jgi:hypothetical protein